METNSANDALINASDLSFSSWSADRDVHLNLGFKAKYETADSALHTVSGKTDNLETIDESNDANV